MAILATLLLSASPEEIVQQMTLPEKIGQLFVVPACPERGEDHLADLHILIKKYHIGGILLKQGDQVSYRKLYDALGDEPGYDVDMDDRRFGRKHRNLEGDLDGFAGVVE